MAADVVDGGAEWRNGIVSALGAALEKRLPPGVWLDYGSGQGLLAIALRKLGIEVEEYDLYRGHGDFPQGVYATVSCIEVIEHCVDPVDLLCRLRSYCHSDGVIVLSTWLRDPQRHGADWKYLARDIGQHITFCSRDGLRAACRRADLNWLCTVYSESSEELQLHCLSRSSVTCISSAANQAGLLVAESTS